MHEIVNKCLDKDDSNPKIKIIANIYRNKFIIPLDFEMLKGVMPYYQSGLGNRLCYEITFNSYDRVIISLAALSSPKFPDAKYKITDASLEYETVTQQDLASRTEMEYQSMVLPYYRIIRNRQILVNKSDTTWYWSLTSLVSH